MERMRNLKLTLEYDGSRFFGFQRQKHKPTIQSALETALSKLFNRRMKISAAAGRTDSGVHATGQVVNFKTRSPLPLEKIQKGLNALLPKEIAVREAQEAPPVFHARYGARRKTYEYLVLNSKVRSPILSGRVYHYPYPLNLERIRRAARALRGRHDFKAFQAAGSNAKTSVRRIHGLKIQRQNDLIRFVIQADGFLYHMVRNLVGTLLEVGRKARKPEDIRKILKKRSRPLAGHTVPGHALTLVSVDY